LSFVVQVRRAAELDVAEAQLWYETQLSGLGVEFHSEVSQVIDRLSQTPLIYQAVYRDIRRAIVHRFPYLLWYRVLGEVVTVVACTYGGRDPRRIETRLQTD
jgi:toxin ParE1/3/4